MPNQTELLDILLKNRGIIDKEKFLNPSFTEHLYDPFLLKDMAIAVFRIFEAIEKKEKIIIYSDYDCDGIPAAVIMNDFFKKIDYRNFSIYIPDRHDEGYGLHINAIKNFIKEKVNLLITFDLGITSVKEVDIANKGGIDVVIVDHHLPLRNKNKDFLPKAIAIIDPKREGCDYPDRMLCGAGLAFKLIQALIKKYKEQWKIYEGWEKWLLDMAGVATLSDQVPLLNENRVLAYYGLKVLKKTHRPGLIELFRKAGVNMNNLVEEDITFTLAPRLNAASRMASPMLSFDVLSTEDLVLAKSLADNLEKINKERKYIVAQIMKEVKKILTKRIIDEENDTPIIVIGNPKWRVGVVGIVAAKISEEYKRPAFVWGTDGNDEIKGSCRSYGNINLVELMRSLPDNSLLGFGGHAAAGGFSCSHKEIHFLEERLKKAFNNKKIDSNYKKSLEKEEKEILIDSLINIDDIDDNNYKVIEQMAPFGVGNPKPIFKLENIEIYSYREFGKDKNHLEVIFKNSRGLSIKAIAFFKTNSSFNNILEQGKKITMLVNFEKNTFAGRTELRLRILDII